MEYRLGSSDRPLTTRRVAPQESDDMMRTTTMCASAMRAGANPTAAMDQSTADLSDMEYPGPVSITVTADGR